jgi:GTP-binding protein
MEILEEADIIVLLFEAGDISLEDEEFIDRLRPYQGKLIAAVNKTEGGRREAEAWNLLSYGFEKVYMISAEHGDNILELEEAIASRLPQPEAPAQLEMPASSAADGQIQPRDDIIRIAILGKPNTGKSTLSNRLTSSSASIVSDIPGTTRDVVEGSFTWKNRDFLVLDTAGIRRKSKVYENIEYYSVNRAIKTIDEADIVFLVIDAQESLTDQDKKIAALAHDKGRGLILVLNKWDTMPAVKNTFEAVSDRIHFLFGQMEYAPIIALSALNGSGIEELLNISLKMYDQLKRQIETAALNNALEKWLTEYPPPSGPRTRFKIRYAVQKEANPVRFIFFTSRTHAVSDTYVAYLRNRIRRDLGFSLVPVAIDIRSSSKPPQTAHRQSSSRKKRS